MQRPNLICVHYLYALQYGTVRIRRARQDLHPAADVTAQSDVASTTLFMIVELLTYPKYLTSP